jgi:hypothetical protein
MGWLPKGIVLSLLRKLMSVRLFQSEQKCRAVRMTGGSCWQGGLRAAMSAAGVGSRVEDHQIEREASAFMHGER